MTWLVTVWTAVAFGGMAVSTWSVWDSWLDWRATSEVGNGRRVVARAMVRSQTLRFTVFALFAALGVAVLADWPVRRFSAAVLVVSACLILVDSALDALVRRRF